MENSFKGLRKGTWTAEEDSLLRQCIDKYGESKWHQVPLRAGLNRCRKSCRLRWLNYLKPSIKRGKFCSDEVDLLLRLHKLLGNRWSLIAGRLPGRTANDIKNYWNTHLSKKHDELCCKTKMINRNITSHPTTSAQKIDVLKPRPRSFSDKNSCNDLNVLPKVDVVPSWFGLNNNNVCERSITCNKDEQKDKLTNNLMDGDNTWWESLLEESQEADLFGPEATITEKGETSAFDVSKLWGLFHEETVELN
ncbi:unnamed protein product [Arabidopsis lyrata]|uniref:Uncharacterized protein n=1 Tax=Arabidopsis lyrata subsp. lyrata TaxID=81972 RepID=D7KTP0_ARALL|nr:transcription factor MYB113 [Arabidopsis lyrata subsp. lyrata]EFH63289.1 hypothetical protein ARALYDRAFT_475739 [Arabidopsis lyrata subsp. lyrata]CAH8257171.1 unnamed protein product [Arabidopsis lyrata]|eukprot:XP_002887030.1 transcription factor MYB113 [Arabidopsis lyrata subsp. lyrata]